MSDAMINVEVVYGTPEKQKILSVSVAQGLTVADVIAQSDIRKYFPEIDLDTQAVGIWNKTCKLTDIPRQGDRIEIYRPLIADPKEIRRRRAEQAKAEGRADKVTGGRPDRKRRDSDDANPNSTTSDES